MWTSSIHPGASAILRFGCLTSRVCLDLWPCTVLSIVCKPWSFLFSVYIYFAGWCRMVNQIEDRLLTRSFLSISVALKHPKQDEATKHSHTETYLAQSSQVGKSTTHAKHGLLNRQICFTAHFFSTCTYPKAADERVKIMRESLSWKTIRVFFLKDRHHPFQWQHTPAEFEATPKACSICP